MKKLLTVLLAVCLTLGVFASCGKSSETVIKVAATSTPHALILEQCVPLLKEKGYTLEIKVMDGYIQENPATEDGDVDANYFQHKPYLDDFNVKNKGHLVSIAQIHYEPYGIYAGTSKSLSAIPSGAKVAVPNDTTNEARALLLLEQAGLITLNPGLGLNTTKNDIAANPKNLDIVELDASLIPGLLNELAVAVINGNYAIAAGFKVSEALVVEDKNSTAAQTYANILVVKEGNENLPKILALKEALCSEAVKNYINATFEGSVIPIF